MCCSFSHAQGAQDSQWQQVAILRFANVSPRQLKISEENWFQLRSNSATYCWQPLQVCSSWGLLGKGQDDSEILGDSDDLLWIFLSLFLCQTTCSLVRGYMHIVSFCGILILAKIFAATCGKDTCPCRSVVTHWQPKAVGPFLSHGQKHSAEPNLLLGLSSNGMLPASCATKLQPRLQETLSAGRGCWCQVARIRCHWDSPRSKWRSQWITSFHAIHLTFQAAMHEPSWTMLKSEIDTSCNMIYRLK